MIGATLALVLDDFKSYEQYLTTIIGSRLLVRAQRMFFMVQQPHFRTFWCWMIFAKEKIYGRFLWMAFHCLNNTEPIWGESLLFTTESPGFVLSQTWSHQSVFNQGLLDWKSSSLNTRPLQHQMHIKLFKNVQLASLTSGWRYWWPTVAVNLFLICKFSRKKNHIFKVDMLSLYGMKELWTNIKKSTNLKPPSA